MKRKGYLLLFLFLAFCLFVFISGTLLNEGNLKFIIKKGEHYHSNLLARFWMFNFQDSIKYRVKFDEGCYYPRIDANSMDLNKLFGAGAWNHHKNSVRFAWRPDFKQKNVIEIWAYWYEDKKREMKKIRNVWINSWEDYKIKKTPDGFVFTVGTKSLYIDFSPPQPFWIRLWPYFGGDNTAPNTMTIEFR